MEIITSLTVLFLGLVLAALFGLLFYQYTLIFYVLTKSGNNNEGYKKKKDLILDLIPFNFFIRILITFFKSLD